MTDMPLNGSFSYKNDRQRIINFNDNYRVKIVKLDEDIAQLYFTDLNNTEYASIPEGFSLRHAMSATDAARLGNSFIITWSSSYVVFKDGVSLMQLDTQRQQSIQIND